MCLTLQNMHTQRHAQPASEYETTKTECLHMTEHNELLVVLVTRGNCAVRETPVSNADMDLKRHSQRLNTNGVLETTPVGNQIIPLLAKQWKTE